MPGIPLPAYYLPLDFSSTDERGREKIIKNNTAKDGGPWKLYGRQHWKSARLVQLDDRYALRVPYPKGSGTSSSPNNDGGCAFSSAPWSSATVDQAIVSFQVYFGNGFDYIGGFQYGGKIAGFHVGDPRSKASGKEHSEAASFRMMWRERGSAVGYVYVPKGVEQPDKSLEPTGESDPGVDIFKGVFPEKTLKLGQWNTIKIGVKLNTFDADGKPRGDGRATLTINGKGAEKTNIVWRDDPARKISLFKFNTFFGGPEHTRKDCVAYFSRFNMDTCWTYPTDDTRGVTYWNQRVNRCVPPK
jgi:hypothetical protein